MWTYDDYTDYAIDLEDSATATATATTARGTSSMDHLPLKSGHTYRLNTGQEVEATEGPDPDHVYMDVPGCLQLLKLLKLSGQSVGHYVQYYTVAEVTDKTVRLQPQVYQILADSTGLTALKEEQELQEKRHKEAASAPHFDPYEVYRTLCDLGEWEPE